MRATASQSLGTSQSRCQHLKHASSRRAMTPLMRQAASTLRLSRQGARLSAQASAQQPEQPEQPGMTPSNEVRSAPVMPAVATATVLAQAAMPLCFDGGNGNGNGSSSGGGGGGGDGSGGYRSPQEILNLAEDDEEEGEEEEEEEEEETESEEEVEEQQQRGESSGAPEGAFVCGELVAKGLPVGEGVPTQEDLFAGLHCQPGESVTRQELSEDMKVLYSTNLFESVQTRVEPGKKNKYKVVFDFIEKQYPPMVSFDVEGAKSLPKKLIRELQEDLKKEASEAFTMKTMAKIKNKIEGWYQSRGYGICYIEHFTGMPTGEVVAHVREGRTSKVNVVYMDEDGTPLRQPGKISPAFVKKHVPIVEGDLYNMNDGRKTLQNVFALDLFDNVQILPRQNEKDPSKVEVDVMVREKPTQTADIEAEWALAAGESGLPAVVSLMPGGTINYENRNCFNKVGTFGASINTKNFLSPSDDLSFRFTYTQPYLYGLRDEKRTKLHASMFNGRKLCGVFTPGPGGNEVPPVWIDRTGLKVAISEQYSRQSRGTLGIVAQEVSARDETGGLCTRGMRANAYGQYTDDGPPTTLSEAGRDRMVYAQGSLVRDTTYLVNGGQVGSRDIFTVDQGLGIGTKAPFFNRFTARATRFIQLWKPRQGSKSPPATLVLSGGVGNTLGDLPAYDVFLLGGPHSVRGFNYGELAACRRYAEGAVELRLPVLNQTAYGFYEFGTDLGSSEEVRGNPTEYYRRVGRGSSCGGGLKLGALRAEMVRDNNSGKWDLFLAYGERF